MRHELVAAHPGAHAHPRARSTASGLVLALALLSACAGARPRPAAGLPSGAAPSTAEPPATAAPEASPSNGEPATADAPELAPAPAPAEEDPDRAALRERIVAEAARLLGTRPRLDCSGYVLAAYRAAGLQLSLPPARNRSVALLEAGTAPLAPHPGDLAFFHDTFDRNRNGRVDDGITHVALVEAVDGDRVTLLHRGRTVERLRMDLANPSDRGGNDPVRFRRKRDRPGTRYLAGELFVAFGGLLDGAVTQRLQASRAEDTETPQPVRRWSRRAPSKEGATSRASRSTPARGSSSSGRAASGGSSPSTRRSSSPSSASAAPGEPSSRGP